jgi:6-pyruvoyltetrahydropterin/6-carboxytetrahydropterin synthase
MHTIERYHDISCGHRVAGHESKCAHLHGHNYRITFVCAAVVPMIDVTTFGSKQVPELVPGASELDPLGRVIDFSVVKARLCQWLEDNWDHKFLCWEDDTEMQLLQRAMVSNGPHTAKLSRGLVWTPFNPTAENLAQYLVDVVGPQQLANTGVRVIACKVEETRKCSATYFSEDK